MEIGQRDGERKWRIILAIALLTMILASSYIFALPFGATPTEIQSETASPDAAGQVAALAGNLTELNIAGVSVTQTWQGYYGNISGTVTLEDSSGRVLYNWTLAQPEGEIYAANNTVSWTNIQCFNFTAVGNFSMNDTAGDVSLYGLNVTQLESQYQIGGDDVDGVNETFFDSTSHDTFFVSHLQFSVNECPATNLYSENGPIASQFQEVLLYDPNGRIPVFASILENNILGFDSRYYDFEMLVLENGNGTDTVPTNYYFYVEIE